jgi:hypothetical protein
MNSIPASRLANVIPGVLSAGGNPLSLNSVYLTNDPSIPIGTAQPFANAEAASNWFGANAPETALANVYFGGYTNCTTLPSVLFFVQFNSAAVAAYVRGASVAGLSLAQIQALSGTISLSIDGEPQTSAAINLSAATGPSNAAALIQTGIQNATGRFSGTAAQTAAADVMNVTATASGQLNIGDVLTGASVDAGLTVLSFGTYTPTAGTGTVIVSTNTGFASTSVSVAGVGTVSYDSLRGAFVITSPTTGVNSLVTIPAASSLTTGLLLTAATGAVASPGAVIAVPATLMNRITGITQNWATFLTVSEQTLSVKEAFAAWVQTTNKRYLYVCQDSDVTALQANSSGCFGAIVDAANDDGIMPVYDNSGTGVLAALQTAIAASINFSQQNGRTTFAFRGQAGLTAQITDETVYDNLLGNGYNCYASFATANAQFTQNQPGQISGVFGWADTYINQIYLNASFQLAIMTLLANTPAVPYVTRGYNLIRGCLLTPIKAALNFGSIVSGVTLSGSQSAALNSATGDPNATATIQNTGWYLSIKDPGAIVRGNRGTPVIDFFYTDGGSVQNISMSSVDVL